jgi:cobyrinic acid a,c-diamide synthase
VPTLPPRLVVAGTHSGVGKTTVATGLMAAFARRGFKVAGAKVGPDFIDPGYHRAATGRASASLDWYLHGPGLLGPLAAASAEGADLLIVEGVMGLFDGTASSAGSPTAGSTAEVAKALAAPTLLVVDASAMSSSVAALVHGYASFDPTLRLAGVVLNRVGGNGHASLLKEALAPLGTPVLGWLRADEQLAWRERHLGLVPVAEHPEAVRRSLGALATVVASSLDLDAIARLAAQAPELRVGPAPQAALYEGSGISSENGAYYLAMQTDGNLVLYSSTGAVIWSTGTWNSKDCPSGNSCVIQLDMQTDGNLVLYSHDETTGALTPMCWAYGSYGSGSFDHMLVNDNGTVTVQPVTETGGQNVWTSSSSSACTIGGDL